MNLNNLLGIIIGLTGFCSYAAFDNGHHIVGLIILILGYLVAFTGGLLIGLLAGV